VWRKYNHPKGQGEAKPHDYYINEFEHYSHQFYEEVFGFLDVLQKRGLRKEDPVQVFNLELIAIEGIRNEDIAREAKPRRFPVFAPQSASFTLWWRDGAKNGIANTRVHDDDLDVDQALRVFVQFQGFQDHITLTFYIDAAKLFTGRQILKREEVEENRLGERRTCLLNHLDTIRSSSYDRIVSGAIDLPSSDRPVDPVAAKALKTAADYVFEDIWNEFQSAFGFRTRTQDEQDPQDGAPFLDYGLIFVNQRGLMMSVRGLKTEDDEERRILIDDLKARNDIDVEDEDERAFLKKPWRQLGRSASGTLGPVDVFDTKSGEPETVLKSLWPFLCQMTEHSARKDWVGCGVVEWRALFMSTLGSRAQPPVPDGAGDVPMHRRTLVPDRFFIVTKGEPHRRQIGRNVERLLSLETMRAIAFKNLGTIQNSSQHLRILTMELDDILEQWAVERKRLQKFWDEIRRKYPDQTVTTELDAIFEQQLAALLKKEPWYKLWNRQGRRGSVPPEPEYILAQEIFYNRLSELNANYESKLIDIAASLEGMGLGGSGHLAHSIDEASYYIGEFDRMVETLEIGNIAGWINYAQFADRGMRPTFNMIKNTGQRLTAAQDRLKAMTDVVQVSALIVQSDATRRNTATLRDIAYLLNWPHLLLRRHLGPILFAVLIIAAYYAGLWKEVKTAWEWTSPHFHAGVVKAVQWIGPYLHW
jgi:hypothetical protein